jgi:hypothetical protein
MQGFFVEHFTTSCSIALMDRAAGREIIQETDRGWTRGSAVGPLTPGILVLQMIQVAAATREQ